MFFSFAALVHQSETNSTKYLNDGPWYSNCPRPKKNKSMARRQITRKDHKFDCREHLWSFVAVWRCTVNSSVLLSNANVDLTIVGSLVLTRAESSSTISAFSEIWISQRRQFINRLAQNKQTEICKIFFARKRLLLACLTSSTTTNELFSLNTPSWPWKRF